MERVVAAAIGGTITAIVVKARLQVQKDGALYKGTLDAFVKIPQKEGLSTLWRGIVPTIYMTIPASALYFTSYEAFKGFLYEQLSKSSPSDSAAKQALIPAIAGLAARTLTATITSPLEMIRTHLQATPSNPNQKECMTSLLHHSTINRHEALSKMLNGLVKKGGIGLLWSGLMPTLLRDAPFSAIYWSGYEFFKKTYSTHSLFGLEKKRFVIDFLSGASAGMVAACLTNPVDVIKTRRQLHIVPPSTKYPNWVLFKTILYEEGVAGFAKGMVPRVVKVAPSCAIMISSYELCKSYLSAYRH